MYKFENFFKKVEYACEKMFGECWFMNVMEAGDMAQAVVKLDSGHMITISRRSGVSGYMVTIFDKKGRCIFFKKLASILAPSERRKIDVAIIGDLLD